MVSITTLFGGWLGSGLRVEAAKAAAALAAGFFAVLGFVFAVGFLVVAFFATAWCQSPPCLLKHLRCFNKSRGD
jgi:hypothetical protein